MPRETSRRAQLALCFAIVGNYSNQSTGGQWAFQRQLLFTSRAYPTDGIATVFSAVGSVRVGSRSLSLAIA